MRFPRPPGPSLVLWLLCFGSIWTLLGFTWGLASMHALGIALLLPTLAALCAGWWWARRAGHADLDAAMTTGLWGGVWGTLGYDLVRIPLHLMGLNPLAPIRSYGMFLLDVPHATLWSDLAGVLYHFSNGITFGWMYALLMLRRGFGWAVLWGLVLETFAVVTPFGEMYGVRHNPQVLAIAYFAHLYYGLPLGWACADPDRFARVLGGPLRVRVIGATAVATAFVVAFLTLAWERPWRGPDLPPGVVQVGPDAVYYGWTRADGAVVVRNAADREIAVEIPGKVAAAPLAPGEERRFDLPPGLHQIRTPGEPWRSAFVSVEVDGFPLPVSP